MERISELCYIVNFEFARRVYKYKKYHFFQSCLTQLIYLMQRMVRSIMYRNWYNINNKISTGNLMFCDPDHDGS